MVKQEMEKQKRCTNGKNCGSTRLYGVKMEVRQSRPLDRVPWQMARRSTHTPINIHNKIMTIFTISDIFSIMSPTIN